MTAPSLPRPAGLPRPGRRLAALVAPLAAGLVIAPAASDAISLKQRTYRISVTPAGLDTGGASQEPALSVDGRTVAFATTGADVVADDANGPVSDIVAADLATGLRRLVSEAPGGADGPSVTPTVSGNGQVVAFATYATNLVAGDTNGHPDVVVRDGRKAPVLVSVGLGGAPADGPSYQPDVSSDGRWVAFTSEATNLVPNDRNGRPDVFARHLQSGRTVLVSRAMGGDATAGGRSSQPAISADGRYVAFESAAADLVPRDNNGISDVFVRDVVAAKTERVSVTSRERQQNKSVPPAFSIAPDISNDGRFVVFESDATNLGTRDTNQRTDVFLRDRREGTTRIVSASTTNVQGNNDSFNPRIAAGGDFIAFQSFASNLVHPGDDPAREDVFVRDLRTGTTTVANVTASGAPRQAELSGQFLQRPALSTDGRVVAFATTVANMVPNDGNGVADVFVRRLDPPVTRIRQRSRTAVRISADDPAATRFVCRVDRRDPYLCDSTPAVTARGRSLTIRAGGPGLLFDPEGVRVALRPDRRRPTVRISAPGRGALRTIRGAARDTGGAGLDRVTVSVTYQSRGRCRSFDGERFVRARSCATRRFVPATGRRSWRLRLPRAIRGAVIVYARSYDASGNRSPTARRVILTR
ncbi:MAG TPA: hypothetical protein VD931_06650 [Baekduia sp.]|nr:hypothetical protein [Baekduia sp.]